MEYRKPWEIPQDRASGRERLAQLAQFLDALPSGGVSLTSWQTCAVGLAAKHPWFLAQGLALENDERIKDCRPTYAGRSDWIAVATFFETTVGDVRHLLDPTGYDGELRPNSRRMAEKIRRHLAVNAAAE